MVAETPKEKLKALKDAAKSSSDYWIKVGYSTCGVAAGAKEVFDVLKEEVKKQKLNIQVKKCGCAGMCYAEPLIEIKSEGMPQVYYGKLDENAARTILKSHVIDRILVDDHIYDVKTGQVSD